jgi:hypothetical protein
MVALLKRSVYALDGKAASQQLSVPIPVNCRAQSDSGRDATRNFSPAIRIPDRGG